MNAGHFLDEAVHSALQSLVIYGGGEPSATLDGQLVQITVDRPHCKRDDNWLTLDETARYLKRSPSAVRSLIHRGGLACDGRGPRGLRCFAKATGRVSPTYARSVGAKKPQRRHRNFRLSDSIGLNESARKRPPVRACAGLGAPMRGPHAEV